MNEKWNGVIKKIGFTPSERFVVSVVGEYGTEVIISDISKLIELLPHKVIPTMWYDDIIGQIITVLAKDGFTIGFASVIHPNKVYMIKEG